MSCIALAAALVAASCTPHGDADTVGDQARVGEDPAPRDTSAVAAPRDTSAAAVSVGAGPETEVLAEGGFVAVDEGYLHSCALRVGGEVVCWGYDKYGETAAPEVLYS